MKYLKFLMIPVLAISLAACQTGGPKQTGGTLLGAGLGALAGSQIGGGRGQLVFVAIGALAGAMIGSEVGASLDRADKLTAQRNTQYALERAPTNRRGPSWRNPDNGNSGYTIPTRTYQARSGQYCREYTQTVYVGGKQQDAYGKACRQQDGTWKIVNN